MDEKQEIEWVARCAYRLRQRWRTVDAGSLEQLAQELRTDSQLAQLAPDEAAVEWLRRGSLAAVRGPVVP